MSGGSNRMRYGTDRERDIDALAGILSSRFGEVAVRQNYGWPGKPAICVLDCVLSINRHYDRVVYPRVCAFVERFPDVTELTHLQSLLEQYTEMGEFCRQCLNYNDPRRERTLRGSVSYLIREQATYPGASEWERLQSWAITAAPGDYRAIGVSGFGLSALQYMRMLCGVQTTKPDVHVRRFVSEAVGRRVKDFEALALLEAAAVKAGLPLREVDGAIWKAAARPQASLV